MANNLNLVDVLNALLRQDLSSFIQRVFATVDPGSIYHRNWHIDAIAHQLERVERGEITRLGQGDIAGTGREQGVPRDHLCRVELGQPRADLDVCQVELGHRSA